MKIFPRYPLHAAFQLKLFLILALSRGEQRLNYVYESREEGNAPDFAERWAILPNPKKLKNIKNIKFSIDNEEKSCYHRENLAVFSIVKSIKDQIRGSESDEKLEKGGRNHVGGNYALYGVRRGVRPGSRRKDLYGDHIFGRSPRRQQLQRFRMHERAEKTETDPG